MAVTLPPWGISFSIVHHPCARFSTSQQKNKKIDTKSHFCLYLKNVKGRGTKKCKPSSYFLRQFFLAFHVISFLYIFSTKLAVSQIFYLTLKIQVCTVNNTKKCKWLRQQFLNNTTSSSLALTTGYDEKGEISVELFYCHFFYPEATSISFWRKK